MALVIVDLVAALVAGGYGLYYYSSSLAGAEMALVDMETTAAVTVTQ